MDKKICVMGLGYIGLPTASLLATKGFQVHGVDVNENAVEMINSGKVHIYEPDLDILVKAAVQSGKLKACYSLKKLIFSFWQYQRHLKMVINQI